MKSFIYRVPRRFQAVAGRDDGKYAAARSSLDHSPRSAAVLCRPEADTGSRPAWRARPKHNHNPVLTETTLRYPSTESRAAARRKPELQTREWLAPRSAHWYKTAAARAGSE